ncbi:MAG: NAD(P)-dependent oxidoreductase [Natronomonas sp.]
MIPLFHDFTDERVLVFGGGPVGARKSRRFSTEATVVVVSPTFEADDYGDAELLRAAPDPDAVSEWIDRIDPALVVAATDVAAVNEAIAAAAADRGILLNRADTSEVRDAKSVAVPATIDEGPVTVAVSSGATSPAFAKELRNQIEERVTGAGEAAVVVGELRERLKAEAVEPEKRRAAIRAAVDAIDWKDLDTGSAKPRRSIETAVRDTLEEHE